MNLTINTLYDISEVAKDFLTATSGKKHIAFYGSMGAGKTTFIKEICSHLGVMGVVTSPTFAIVNEYLTNRDEIIYHFDFYRINNIEELFDLGYEEYLYGTNYCFIEWPEKGESLIPEHFLKVTIKETPNGERIISF